MQENKPLLLRNLVRYKGEAMRTRNFIWVAGLLGLCALVGFAPSAHATEVDFFCSVTNGSFPCTGTVATAAGPQYSSTGIDMFNTNGPYSSATVFTFTFDTSTGAIKLTDGTNTLTGKINSFTSGPSATLPGTTDVLMKVSWTSLPAAVQSQLGTVQGTGLVTSVDFQISNSTAQVIHIIITPVPEPGSLTLFGSGLLAVGALVRRKFSRG